MPSSTKLATRAAGENGGAPLPASSLAHDLEVVCRPYVDAFFRHLAHPSRQQQQQQPPIPPPLQARASANSDAGQPGDARKRSLPLETTAFLFAAPEALVHECSRLIDEAVARSGAANAAPMRSAAELGAENVYLRALLSRMLQQHQHGSSASCALAAAEVEEVAPVSRLSPHPETQLSSPERAVHVEGSDSRRSPSAACPEPTDHVLLSAGAIHRAFVGRKTVVVDPREASPATAGQVGELQEQIELLREAVRELSQQASVTRGYSASPLPAETRAATFAVRAVSPSPRCATPTCTTDVPTLQRIILHQQQTIQTLQLEVEEMASAKVQIERLLHLHEAATTASAAAALNASPVGAVVEDEEEDTPCLAATTHWRSTCHTDGCASDATPLPYSPVQGSASATAHEAETVATAEEMYRMDFDAATEMPKEKRRAATFGGTRPPTWFDTAALSAEEPFLLTGSGGAAGSGSEEDEAETGDDVPSSGMRTPLPRRTVVLHPLHLRFSSATGDSASVTGGGTEESPVMRPTKASYGTLSNRRTSVMGSFSAM